MSSQNPNKKSSSDKVNKYPSNLTPSLWSFVNLCFCVDSFLFGTVCGVLLNISSRVATQEPLSASNTWYRTNDCIRTIQLHINWIGAWFLYLVLRLLEKKSHGRSYGGWRNQTLSSYTSFCSNSFVVQLRGLNKVRYGEEEDITNLMDYMTNATVRPWFKCILSYVHWCT